MTAPDYGHVHEPVRMNGVGTTTHNNGLVRDQTRDDSEGLVAGDDLGRNLDRVYVYGIGGTGVYSSVRWVGEQCSSRAGGSTHRTKTSSSSAPSLGFQRPSRL